MSKLVLIPLAALFCVWSDVTMAAPPKSSDAAALESVLMGQLADPRTKSTAERVRGLLKDGDREKAKAAVVDFFSHLDAEANYRYTVDGFYLAKTFRELSSPADGRLWYVANVVVALCIFPAAQSESPLEALDLLAEAADIVLSPPALLDLKPDPEVLGSIALTQMRIAAMSANPKRGAWAARALDVAQQAGQIQKYATWPEAQHVVAAANFVAGRFETADKVYSDVISNWSGPPTLPPSIARLPGIAMTDAVVGKPVLLSEAATAAARAGHLERALVLLQQSRSKTGAGADDGLAQTLSDADAKTLVIIQLNRNMLGTLAVASRTAGKTTDSKAFFDDRRAGMSFLSEVIGTKDHATDGAMADYSLLRLATWGPSLSVNPKLKSSIVPKLVNTVDASYGGLIRDSLAWAGPERSNVLLIEPGNMSMFPLGLLPFGPKALNLSHSVRVQSRLYSTSSSSTVAATVAIVAGSSLDSGLAFLDSEARAVATAFGEEHTIRISGGAAPAILKAMDGRGYVHIASHGRWDPTSAAGSGIVLAAGGMLSVADVSIWHPSHPPRLVFLSACESGQTTFMTGFSAAKSLPDAFLDSGARGVVATLWPVPDGAAYLLTTRFYDELIKRKRSPPDALRASQIWLSTITQKELMALLRERVMSGAIDKAPTSDLESYLTNMSPEQHPYADPYYWGGYQFYGS